MSGEDIDSQKAESIARDRLVKALGHPGESTRSDVAQLAELTASIKGALWRGETPKKIDIEEAWFYTEKVEKRPDEVTALFGWNPRDLGATWGELIEEQKAEIEERDRQRCEDDIDESETNPDGDDEDNDEAVLAHDDLVVLRTNLEEGPRRPNTKGAPRGRRADGRTLRRVRPRGLHVPAVSPRDLVAGRPRRRGVGCLKAARHR